MSDPFEVITVGVDSSSRPVKMTRRMKQAYDIVDAHVGGALVIVQGAFRGADGADASAGTHAQSGCLDIRTWNLTVTQRNSAQRKAREIGWAAWYRTPAQGFDPHMHWLLLGDRPLHPDAAYQERAYRAGLNGLASGAPDDFWRPSPIPTYQYRDEQEAGDELQASEWERLDGLLARKIAAGVKPLEDALSAFRQNELERDTAEQGRDVASREREQAILAAVAALPDDKLTREDVRAALTRVLNERETTP